jgi:hypothetical protein
VADSWQYDAVMQHDGAVKMAAPLATCTKQEQCSEGVKSIKINQRMKVQYGDACLSLWQVYKWTEKFMNGISSVTDSPRPSQATE